MFVQKFFPFNVKTRETEGQTTGKGWQVIRKSLFEAEPSTSSVELRIFIIGDITIYKFKTLKGDTHVIY